MSNISGVLLVDAPASALNNSGQDDSARTENAVAVKFIRAPDGHYPYVSAQAVRYWLRTQLSAEQGWTAAPVFREEKVAYTDAEPTLFAEDDLFGYMRAPKGMESEQKARASGATALETVKKNGKDAPVTLTRISPLRIGTLVSTAPVRITGDFGTMARANGDPVPYEHQFYRAHLKAPWAVDLTSAGTFYVSQRVGYKNIDKHRIESAEKAGAETKTVRGFDARRLPLDTRRQRVAMLVRALGRLEGGAKQTLHLTDTAPAATVHAVFKSGNQPLQRVFSAGELGETVFRDDVLAEALRVFKSDLVSHVYIGWAKGFLDSERKKLDAFLADGVKTNGVTIEVGHPREVADAFATALLDNNNSAWFD